MDTQIKVKQEVPLELSSQNQSDSFPKEPAVRKYNDTTEWYDNCEMGIKMEIKEEAPFIGCFSQTERQGFTKDLGKKIKKDTYTYCIDTENDTEAVAEESVASDDCSENERQFLPKDVIKMEYSSDCEIEIKEEPWLERTAGTLSDCEEMRDGRNAAELPRLNTELVLQESALNSDPLVRNDLSLNPKLDSSETKEIRKQDIDIRETFSIEESVDLEHPSQHMDVKIYSAASVQQKLPYGCDIDSKNITCNSALDVNSYKCAFCEKTLTSLSSMKRHNLIHTGMKPHKCKVCGKSFTLMSSLKEHIHEEAKPHKCEICEKTFTWMSQLKQHIPIHKDVKPHKCDICGKTFAQMSHLKKHILIHKGEKPYKCEVCEKTFVHLSYLKQHIVIHKGVKPHKCELCEKTFSHMSSLKEHILIHNGEKPHKCEICDKAFARKSNLKQHALIHKQEKPHKCEVCEKTFATLSYLQMHNVTHMGIKPYKCEICGKRFTHMSHFKEHNLIHMEVKPR